MKLKSFFSALSFLTLLPVPPSWCGDETSLRKGPAWYPLVGLLIGLAIALADTVLCWLLPLPVASALVVLAMIAISGALHLDGLADSADAFFSGRGREQMLDIMKDSRSGPMGVSAVVVVLLLKFALLISLPDAWRTATLIMMPLAGRSSLLLISSHLYYARRHGTAAFIQTAGTSGPVHVTVITLLVCALFLFGRHGITLTFMILLSIWCCRRYLRRKIGGFTGDTLGAGCELVELVPGLTVLLLAQRGCL